MTRGVGGHGTANIMKHLKKIQFPADRQAILACARSGPGPSTGRVLEILGRLPDKVYHSPSDIARAIGTITKSPTVNTLTCMFAVWCGI
ncbi:MAG: DUF2795 domain-containing protein [Syntrophobacteraceae bacterium]|nr:DUF2795 domain-containing protein [Desulfobacteraceae bacterium]